MRPYIKQWPEVGPLHCLVFLLRNSLDSAHHYSFVHSYMQALAIMGQPTNVVMSLEHLGKLVDDMWFLAGDRSADVRFELYYHCWVEMSWD